MTLLQRGRRASLAMVATAAIVLSGLLAPPTAAEASERGPIIAPRPVHDRVVSNVSVAWTPRILDGRTMDVAQVGDWIIVGGEFTQVAPSSGTPVLNRTNVVAFSATNGAINTNFAPSVSGGQVRAVEPGPIPGTVYLGGSFTGVNGVTRKIVLIDVNTGQLVPGFTGPSMNGAVNDLQLVGDRLYVGGVFKTVSSQPHNGLVALDAMTGARQDFLSVALTENQNYTGQPNQAQGPVGAKKIAVTPQGDQLAVIGNFRKADGLERRQMVLIDLTGPAASVRQDWKTNRLAPACFSNAFDSYVRGLDVSPDGSYFLVAGTGGPNPGTLCDTVSRWNVDRQGQDVQPEWIDDTGGDTLLSVTSSGAAVYTGGHQRWMNNAGGRDFASAGAVPRPGLAAVEVQTGVPVAWNPGRHPRGVGAESVFVTEAGLWVGSDTDRIGNRQYLRPRIAFFPVATGTPLGAGDTGVLPGNVYKAGNAPTATNVGASLYRMNTGGPALAANDGGPTWMADDGATNPYRNSGSNSAGYDLVSNVDSTVPASAPTQLYSSERWSPNDDPAMEYAFPVQTGKEVVVRLFFANRYTGTSGAGQRVFNVQLEGQTVLASYDIVADVGDQTGTMKSFTVTSDGTINIKWLHQTENPLVNGIEILESLPPTEPQPEPTGLSRVWFTGGAVDEPVVSAPAGDLDWTTVRGAVVIDGTLFYGTSSGDFMRRSFDGTTYGSASLIDPYNDPFWSDVDTGSGGRTFRGVRPSFYSEIASLTGMTFDQGRLYYTRVGSNRVTSRAFSPNSGVMTQATVQVPAFTNAPLGGIFFDENSEHLYFVTSLDGNLSRVDWDGSQATSLPVVVSGPSTDGVDWRARALFLADGPAPVANVAPTAVLSSIVCNRLECTFDSAGSSDSDGTITSYLWSFGDETEPATDPVVTHTFAAEGHYVVSLTVTDNRGATHTVTAELDARSNNAPTAVIAEPECELLVCSFDGSGSSDPDTGDSVVSYSWSFGDEGTATGATPTHTFTTAGVHDIVLTVTDQAGATGQATYELTVSDGSGPVTTPAELVGQSAVTSQQSATSVVGVPAQAQAGDLLVLFATSNDAGEPGGPTGAGTWTLERRVVSGPLAVSVFTKVADGSEAGQSVTMTWPNGQTRADLTMLAYRNVGEAGVEALVSSVDANVASHTSPTVSVVGEERVAVSFWADRSSGTTAWTAPAGVDVVSTQVGSGGGRVSTLVTAQKVGAGSYGGLVATTNATSARGVNITLLLEPSVRIVGPPVNHEPNAVIADPVCDLLTCAFDGSSSSDPDDGDSVASYAWAFQGGGSATGATASHTFAAAGTYTVTLTVTDQSGTPGVSTREVTVSDVPPPVATSAELVGQAAAMRQQASTTVITVPEQLQEGDLLVLFATSNEAGATSGPSGAGDWTLARRVLSGPLAVSVFTKLADGSEAGLPVTMTWATAQARTDLTMLAYRNVGEVGIEALESSVDANVASHVSPTVMVPGEERVAVSFWADRSSNTTGWTPPAGVDVLSTQVGSGGGRVSTLVTAQKVNAGSYGGLVATTNAASTRALSITLLLQPGFAEQ